VFKIGIKYFTSSIQRSRLKNVLYLTTISLSINIGVLITAIALIRGFEQSALTKILHIYGHAKIFPYTQLPELKVIESKNTNQLSQLLSKYPVVYRKYQDFMNFIGIRLSNDQPRLLRCIPKSETQGVVSKNRINEGVIIRGIMPNDINFLFKNNVVSGKIDFSPIINTQPIVIGSRLAARLKVNVDDEVELVLNTPNNEIEVINSRIVAVFSFDFADIDSNVIFTTHDFVMEKIGNKPISGILYVDRIDKIEEFLDLVHMARPKLITESWIKQNRIVKDMFDTQIRAIYLLVGLYILSGIIQGLSSLYILLSERSSDISILTLLGMSRWQKCRIFIAYGFLVSLTNTILGMIVGIILTNFYPTFRDLYQKITGNDLIHKDMFWVSDFNPSLLISDLLTIGLYTFIAMVISMSLAAYFISQKEIIKGVKE
jgi:lipoprotein-releasing system permease protein